MIKRKTNCHNKCFSLGFHIDFKHRYIDFHIWNWFIEIGNHKASLLTETCGKELDELWEYYVKRSNEITNKQKDFHPLTI